MKRRRDHLQLDAEPLDLGLPQLSPRTSQANLSVIRGLFGFHGADVLV